MDDHDAASIQSAIAANAYNEQFGVSQTPFHTHNSTDSTPLDYTDLTGRTRFIAYRLLDPVYPVYAGTLIGGYIMLPFAGGFGVPNSLGGRLTNPENPTATIVAFATVDTVGATGNTIINILLSPPTGSTRVSIFRGSFALTIASGATSSIINSIQPSFSTSTTSGVGVGGTFGVGDRLSFDVDSVSTTAPLGLTVYLRVTETSP